MKFKAPIDGTRQEIPARRFFAYGDNARFWFSAHPHTKHRGELTASHWDAGKAVCHVTAGSRIAGVGLSEPHLARAEIANLCERVQIPDAGRHPAGGRTGGGSNVSLRKDGPEGQALSKRVGAMQARVQRIGGHLERVCPDYLGADRRRNHHDGSFCVSNSNPSICSRVRKQS